MTRTSRLLCVLYGVASLWLAFITVQQAKYGGIAAACLFAFASVTGVIAVVREFELADERRATAALRAKRREGSAVRPQPSAPQVVLVELPVDCCERWWTALGADHDPACSRQHR
ncbi:hypothetical protein AB0C77_33585 [Streptomyces sp. NPDC048629]|uniref:hypothetical protein n=1 Tax=Streptomyces sp. NPDC048629 TaxID=3154824 RepID=UPI00343E1D8B